MSCVMTLRFLKFILYVLNEKGLLYPVKQSLKKKPKTFKTLGFYVADLHNLFKDGTQYSARLNKPMIKRKHCGHNKGEK